MNVFLHFISLCCYVTVLTASASMHPNLYFSPDDLTELRHKTRTTHAHIFSRLREAAEEMKDNRDSHLPPEIWDKFASQWNEKYGNDLGALAMYCVLEESDTEARQLALQTMDILSALPNWRVKATMHDDVPVAHSLVAMATAYDFLYDYLDARRRFLYLEKIRNVTKEMYVRSLSLWWGNGYIQNHVATNYVAMLSGALVVERQHKEASVWKKRAHTMLNRTMFLLSHVVDGSLEEGVAYGSYTSRSLTQYLFLAKRHLGLDMQTADSAWMTQHFWFFYRTILPGFRETVGIADSNLNWFYGPESQLVFLDRFVMRNGYGNWLASRIRELRSKHKDLRGSPSHRYCTLHTEFLFYDSTIPEKAPPHPGIPHMHVFSDWGVVTYGGGQVTSEADDQVEGTFLSFKCGVLHGRAVNQIVRNRAYHWISGWQNFNPGHEHPDQGSFVFEPNGVPFITEALYGPKYTWLNNVLLFGPSPKPSCSAPYEGQIGDCGKWMNYKDEQSWLARGEIITASESNGMVFVSGEMSEWYSSSIGVASVYRAVTLLSPGVLLVVDHVEKMPRSTTEYVSAFFHNRNAPFEVKNKSHAEIFLERQNYAVRWSSSNHELETEVQSESAEYPAEYGKRKTHYLNITTNLLNTHTTVAYAFSAHGYKVSTPRLEVENHDVIKVHLKINGLEHRVSIVTRYSSPFTRYRSLGFGGYAMVEVGNSPRAIRFGLENGVDEQFEESRDYNHVRRPRPSYDFRLLLSLPFCFLILMYLNAVRCKCRRRMRCHWFNVLLLSIILCWISLLFTYIFNNCDKTLACSNEPQMDERESWHAQHQRITKESIATVPPLVLYTNFPFSESDILGELFKNNTDFVQMEVKADFGRKPCAFATIDDPEERMCDLINGSSLDINWLRRVLSNPDILTLWKAKQRLIAEGAVAKIRSVPVIDKLVTLLLQDPEHVFVMPFVGVPRIRSVVTIQDPRGWIAGSWFKTTPDEMASAHLRRQILTAFNSHEIESLVSSSTPRFRLEQILAYYWKAQVKRYIALSNRSPLLLIQLEELWRKPTETGTRVYRFLGLPHPPFLEHRLLQYTHTDQYPGGTSDKWKTILSWEQVNVIEIICEKEMKLLGYQPSVKG